MRGPHGTFKRDSWLGCWGLPPPAVVVQPCCLHSPPLPSAISDPFTDAKHKHLLAAGGEGKCTFAFLHVRGNSPRILLSGRWFTNAAGMYGWQGGGRVCCGGHGRTWDAPLQAGLAFVGLCRTQGTTSGGVLAQDYAECSEEPTVNASASSPYSLRSSERTSQGIYIQPAVISALPLEALTTFKHYNPDRPFLIICRRILFLSERHAAPTYSEPAATHIG